MSVLRFRYHHVPWLFAGGLGIVVAVNCVMIWLAVGSFSGLYSGHARERGVHYNDVVAEQRNRDALHWRVEPVWRPESSRLELAIAGPDGRPLPGAQVSGELIRPVERRAPLPVAFRNEGNGRFATTLDLPARGNWDLDIAIEAEGQRFSVTKRMFLR